MSKVIFVSYASGSYTKNIFWNKVFVRLFIRPDKIIFLTDEDLHQDPIYHKYLAVFSAKTGAGYWAWKPWAITKAMNFADDDDIVIYQDCGQGLRYKNLMKPKNIIAYAKKHNVMPGVLIPEHGINKEWTHQQCFNLMGCNAEKFHNTAQVEAVISAWKASDMTKFILSEWLNFCTNENVVSDNYIDKNSSFATKGHRYDQSVLTNLVIKHNLIPIRHNLAGLHLFKSMTLLNLFLARDAWYSKFTFTFIYQCVKILRRIRKK
jgi:hypothetical protein